jgi:hypothetical protein
MNSSFISAIELLKMFIDQGNIRDDLLKGLQSEYMYRHLERRQDGEILSLNALMSSDDSSPSIEVTIAIRNKHDENQSLRIAMNFCKKEFFDWMNSDKD